MARIHFLNVEEGDCSIIQHDNGHVTMIDVCSAKDPFEEISKAEKVFDASESVSMPKGNFQQKYHPENPVSYLQNLGVYSIFRYIQTHPDMDHMDGLQYVDKYFDIYNFWDTANTKEQDFDGCTKYDEKDWECYQKLRKSAENPIALNYYDGSVNKYFAVDDSGRKGDDYLQILAPTPQLMKAANESGDWNDSSYVILYHIQGHKVLFCGDAGNETWKHILTKHGEDVKNLDVLIAPHHGRKGTLDFSFLDVMKPKLSLIGNALSKHLAYDHWNNRKLLHMTNNQAGNVVLEFVNGAIQIYCSNKNFVDAFLADKSWKTYKHIKLDAWYFANLNTN